MSLQKEVSAHTKTLPLIPLLYIAFILNIATIILITIQRHSLPPEIPLLYGNTEGNEQITPWTYLYLPPAVSLIILFINTIYATFVKDKLIRNSLSVVSFICSLFTTIAVIKILNLVGSLF